MDSVTSKERVLPKTDLEWIAHTLSDAEAAIKVLSTMLAKEGLKMGFAVADEILGNVRSAQKNCSHLIERERRTAAEPGQVLCPSCGRVRFCDPMECGLWHRPSHGETRDSHLILDEESGAVRVDSAALARAAKATKFETGGGT